MPNQRYKIILIGAKLWPVGCVTDKQTNGQTDKRTNRQTVMTNIPCEKGPSGFSQSNKCIPMLKNPEFNASNVF